jgi:hypothetical protein
VSIGGVIKDENLGHFLDLIVDEPDQFSAVARNR